MNRVVEISIEQDSLLVEMKRARKSTAVLKTKFATFRADRPDALVFAFEGPDDKTVYYHWIRRIRSELRYEPFACDGKAEVLKFKEMIERDLNDLAKGLYFFVDRDFDDLRGHEPSPSIFMTETYAIENTLVSDSVLEELLKNEFHCYGDITIRRSLLTLFARMYNDFLEITREANFRLFLARRLSIEATLPAKIGKLVNVELDRVSRAYNNIAEIIVLEREPTQFENDTLLREFDALVPPSRFRGKFAMMFFVTWLHLLATDRNSDRPIYFQRAAEGEKVHGQRLTLDCLAAKSDMPEGLADFISAIVI